MVTDDDLFLGLIESITLDSLERIEDDPDARYAFFKRFLGLAQEAFGGFGVSGGGFCIPRHCNRR